MACLSYSITYFSFRVGWLGLVDFSRCEELEGRSSSCASAGVGILEAEAERPLSFTPIPVDAELR